MPKAEDSFSVPGSWLRPQQCKTDQQGKSMCAYLMYVSMLETFDANREPCASFGLMEVGSHPEAGRLCGLLVSMV